MASVIFAPIFFKRRLLLISQKNSIAMIPLILCNSTLAGTTTYQASPGGPVAPKYFWKAVCDPDPSVR